MIVLFHDTVDNDLFVFCFAAFKCLQAGMFADPFDCHAFHMCVGMNYKNYFIDYKMACPVSLVFDDIMDRCQWPQLAQHVSCNYDKDGALP